MLRAVFYRFMVLCTNCSRQIAHRINVGLLTIAVTDHAGIREPMETVADHTPDGHPPSAILRPDYINYSLSPMFIN